jgi:Zn-dependent protease with chaperone function
MHTQAESVPPHSGCDRALLGSAVGLALYLLTLLGEALLGAGPRWLLAYLGAATVGAFVPLGLSAEGLAYVAGLAPLAWSVLALLRPGRGGGWRWRLGARSPTVDEQIAIDDADAILRSLYPDLPEPTVHVLDDPLPAAAARGRAVLISRGLLDSDCLPAVYAHELGHSRSLDARLTEALDRFELWDDPLAPAPREPRGKSGPEPPEQGTLLLGLFRWTLRLAGGGCAESLLTPLWAAYWRRREYAADAYAAALGQGPDLARHLAEHELPLDNPQRRLLLNRAEHPPVALRIERLEHPARNGIEVSNSHVMQSMEAEGA